MNKTFTVDQPKLRLDRFLAEHLKEISRSKISKDIVAGCVEVNGKKALVAKFVVRSGDKVSYDIPPEEAVLPRPVELKILYENPDLLIIDKPAGLVVHPAPGYKGVTLAQGLLHKYKDIKFVGEDQARPGIVHRLDKDTSGVMLVAKTQAAFDYLKIAFAEHRVKKEYIALVWGKLPARHGFIKEAIGRHHADFRKMSAENAKDAKQALTEYSVIKYISLQRRAAASLRAVSARRVRAATGAVDEFTLVRVTLHTGRTHQIRVHFESLGFPVAGDTLYDKRTVPGLHRQFLHASKIEVQLADGAWIAAEAVLPEDLAKVLGHLKK